MSHESQRKPLLMLTANDALLRSIQALLEPVGFDVQYRQNPRDFLIALKKTAWDLVLLDVAIGAENRAELLTATRTIDPGAPVIALIPQDDLPFCVDALQLGANDVITVPLQAVELKFRVAGHYGKRTQPQPGSNIAPLGSVSTPLSRSSASGSISASVSGVVVSGVSQNRAQDLGMLHEIGRFHEFCLRQFISLEKRVLELQERLAEASGVSRIAASSAAQTLLLVHPDSDLLATLQRLGTAYQIAVRQAFTGGEALDSASQNPVDLLICDDDLPDLRGEMVTASLKGELPYVDAVIVSGWGSGSCVGRWIDGEPDQEDEALLLSLNSEEEWTQLLEAFAARRAQRAFGKRLAVTFKEQHRDFMRRYAEIRARLRAALGRSTASSQTPTPSPSNPQNTPTPNSTSGSSGPVNPK